MTSKLFYYFVHQRKYPGLGVFGSAVHRAYRSNVMPCDTEGVKDVREKSVRGIARPRSYFKGGGVAEVR